MAWMIKVLWPLDKSLIVWVQKFYTSYDGGKRKRYQKQFVKIFEVFFSKIISSLLDGPSTISITQFESWLDLSDLRWLRTKSFSKVQITMDLDCGAIQIC